MQNALYAKAPAQTDLSNTRLLTDEAFQLSPEQLVEINRRWSTHMIRQNMSRHCSRILYAIYRHTIEFQKWQDDMSGKRLQQITAIRYDHANETLRILEAGNAIISRTGHYGKWLSINFDFDSWEQNDAKALARRTNNPYQLLPDYCRDQAVDAAPCFAESSSFSSEFTDQQAQGFIAEEDEQIQPLNESENVDHPDSGYTIDNNNNNNITKKTTTTKTRENSEIPATSQEDTQTLLQQMLKQLANLEQKFDQQRHCQPTHSADESDLTPSDHASLASTTDTSEMLETPQTTANPTQYTQSTPTENPADPRKSVVVVNFNNKVNKDLCYPTGMDHYGQQGLANLLVQAGDHAQDLLDLLALRLENTQDPVKNIPLYFSSLVRRLHKNALDLSNLNAHKASQKPPPSAKEKAMNGLQAEFREANADYQHFKRLYKMKAKSAQCSLQEFTAQDGVKTIWQDVLGRLNQVKSAIDELNLAH
jgi:hypothetical protein